MDRDSVALSHLIEAALSIHARNREDALDNSDDSDDSDDFVDFTDDEIRRMVRALWAGRHSTTRREFHEAVGQGVLRWVAE